MTDIIEAMHMLITVDAAFMPLNSRCTNQGLEIKSCYGEILKGKQWFGKILRKCSVSSYI